MSGRPPERAAELSLWPWVNTIWRCGSNDNAHAVVVLRVIPANSRKHGPGEQAALYAVWVLVPALFPLPVWP